MAGPTMFSQIFHEVTAPWCAAFQDLPRVMLIGLVAQLGLLTPADAQEMVREGRPAARPQPIPVRADPPGPQLQTLLTDWHNATKGVKKIEGEHRRWEYDFVFGVEQRSEGKYYYEAPDKGRIDITVDNEPTLLAAPPGKQKNGQPFAVKLGTPESWVCDGESVTQIDHEAKQYEQIEIPPPARGENIMDGPLPFLFGMPPKKAHARYDIQIVRDEPQRVVLTVHPRLGRDRANWQRAMVILAKPQYMPDAVRIIDPSGNKETTYQFVRRSVNGGNNWIAKLWPGNPFDLGFLAKKGYKRVQNEAGPAVAAAATQPPTVVPSVIGLPWPKAKEILQARGYEMKPERGPAAPNPALKYHVSDQIPPPKSPLRQGQEVRLVIYDEPAAAQ
ncbi:MAG: PASTA domain-containing protein [Planctomycetota bacterium]